MSTIESLNASQQLAHVKLVASSNQSGTYFNGQLNNGVGANFTYATGTLTIDSVTVNLNDYVLLAGQTSAYQNGIYQCTVVGQSGVAAILTRRGDFQCREQIRGGSYVPVSAGTVYAGSMWTVIDPLPAAVGVPVVSGANNINFATITAAGSSLYLQTANNLSEIFSAGAADQASALVNLGVHSAKAVGAGGSATVSVTDTKIAAASVVVASIQASANAVTIEKVTPGSGTLTILCSGDPGANTISYIAISAVE